MSFLHINRQKLTYVGYLDAIKTNFMDLEGKNPYHFWTKSRKTNTVMPQIALAILGLLVEHSLDYKI